ncbi:hypothetical protein K2173_016172 [Erythroxylum novogranatense]|uniref:Ubiquitin carboxyl-terminal hydrolase n=1 Tax=Erythroxylum novogranatense TaxID=1862640 RepID=A0AAV8SG60_9ROSI|nr:hypothetical protein K2173_016172 [Erythroxylum novogranatense]
MENPVMSSDTEVKTQSDSVGYSCPGNGSLSSPTVSTSSRRVEFHPARQSFGGIGNRDGGVDFRIETLNSDSSRKRPAGEVNPGQSAKKIEVSDFVESGLDPEFNFGITFRRIGAGLENLGNTCFLNSVLQCLTYTEPLAAYLQSGKHQNSCHISGFCALCAIQKHVSRALQSTGRSLIPKDLVYNLRCISRNFRYCRQEDAHEYMVNLLESMHRCCLPSGVPTESPAAYEKSLVYKIFGGRLCSQVECQQCFFCSNKFDPFLDLSLEIVKADSLPVALQNFTAAELLDGGEKQYQCEQCKQKVRAKKRLAVHKAPYVLTIHLKRFYAHDPGRKVDKKVYFEPTLEMKPFVSGSYDGDLKYSLYGVLVHFGPNTHSGHYVCFVRTSSGMWYLLNDNEVHQVSEKIVLEQKAYMLFYVRDRKNIATRKPVDIFQKVNVKDTVSSNSADSVLKQFPEHADNDSNVIGTNAGVFSVANKKEALSERSNETLPKEPLSLQNSGFMFAACQVPKQDSVAGPSPAVPLVNNLSVNSLEIPDQRECLSSSNPSLNYNGKSPKFENATSITGSTSDHNENPDKINHTFETGASCNVSPGNSCDKTADKALAVAECQKTSEPALNKADPLMFPCTPVKESSQGIAGPNHRVAGNVPTDQTHDFSQSSAHELMRSSTDLAVSNECLHEKASNECLHKKASNGTVRRKFKRKFMKHQFSRISVGLNFFRASLGLKKKKKHKKSKKYSLDTQNLIKEQLLDNNFFTSETGPSTSKEFSAFWLPLKDMRRNGDTSDLKRGASVQNSGDVSLAINNEGVLVARNIQNGVVLATNKQQNFSISSSEPNQQNARKVGSAGNCGREFPEEESILAENVQQRTVACWDAIQLPSSVIVESNVTNVSIGYVPDERDEEYDRGKRNKLRHSKHMFGGPNPFQEITAKKAQFNLANVMHRSTSGNQPFRI